MRKVSFLQVNDLVKNSLSHVQCTIPGTDRKCMSRRILVVL